MYFKKKHFKKQSLLHSQKSSEPAPKTTVGCFMASF